MKRVKELLYMKLGGSREVEMTDNEILDSVRSYLERATADKD